MELIVLIGKDNFEWWSDNLTEVLSFYGLSDFIHKPVAPKFPVAVDHHDAITAKKGFVLGLIAASVTPILDQLAKAGWNFKKANQEPMELYNLIFELFSDDAPSLQKGDEIATLVEDLCKTQSRMTLSEWKQDIERTKLQLSRQGAPIGDTLAIWLVIKALEDDYPAWYRILLREQYSGNLTWDLLMSKIEAQARDEEEL